MNEPWIEKIRQQMAHHEGDVPQGLFDDIQAEMVRRQQASTDAQHRRALVIPMWVKRLGLSAVAAAAVSLLVVMLMGRSAQQPSPMAQAPLAPAPTSAPAQPSSTASQALEAKAERLVNAVKQWMAPSTMVKTSEAMLAICDGAAANPDLREVPPTPTCTAAPSEPTSSTAEPTSTPRKATPKSLYGSLDASPAHSAHGTLTLGASMQNYGSGPGRGGGEVMGFKGDMANEPVLGDANMLGGIDKAALHLPNATQRTHHRQPVKGGLSLRYQLSDRWSVQTGLNYSYHSSEFEQATQHIDQQLHFLGIPLAAGYSLWQSDHLNVYLTAGGEVEKLVKGKRNIDLGGQQHTEKVKMNRPQVSATLSAGVEYKFTPSLSVYVEPGGAYHFDNGSGISTIYNDRPWAFNLGLGLRFDLNK